jgi:hypothetical protein
MPFTVGAVAPTEAGLATAVKLRTPLALLNLPVPRVNVSMP